MDTRIGRSGGIRTHGIHIPNVARYQLRYTPIFLSSVFYCRAWRASGCHVSRCGGLGAAAVRADLLRDMAQAELILGNVRDAHSHYMAACRLEPHNAMNYVKAAEAVEKQSGREEALRFLREQRKNAWFTPVKYRDSAGRLCTNDLFQELLNANIRKLEQQKESTREESPLY